VLIHRKSSKQKSAILPQANLTLPFAALLVAGLDQAARAQNYAVPALPVIGTTVYNATEPNGGVAGASIDGGATIIAGTSNASSNASSNTTLINDEIAYASAHGGGTVLLPAASGAVTYLSNEVLMENNVNLDVATNATLQNEATTSTFITAASSATGNVEISGGGIINSNATSTSDNKMVQLEGLTNVEVANVTIENAPNEHLVLEADSNVTVNNVTIQDPLKLQKNTDGIDFSGTNFLIENSNISDGDDDIVAKPDTTTVNGITAYTANVVIQNINITAGHGISIGGQTNAGLNGMYVNNVTETATGSNTISQGIHLKAGDGTTSSTQNGGLVENVTFNHITMTGVDNAIILSSYYNNGSDNLPDIPAPSAPTDSTEPIWNNITLENITVNSASGSAAEIYGLNSSPANMNGLNVENVDVLESDSPWKMYYATGIYFNGVTVGGANLPDAEGDYKNSSGTTESDEEFDSFVSAADASPIYTPPLAVPEPASLGFLGGLGLLAIARPRKRRA
jgi:polygalacturonase